MWRIAVSLLLAWCFQQSLPQQLECRQLDHCSCLMNDGSGKIELHSLAHPDNPYRIDHNNFTYMYSPCTAMRNATGECKDAASVCQQFDEGGIGYNYGTADSASFYFDPNTKQVKISYSYFESNMTRNSNVDLICDPGQRERALLGYQGSDPFLMNFKLTSVCACPGGCMAPAVTCTMKDSCTCDMSDGTGAINLHPLDNPWAPLRSSHLQPDLGRNFTYYYNPCSGFSFTNTMCTNVSTCQVDTEAQLFYALGDVAPQPNPDVNQENGSVTFHYVNTEDTGRHSDIRLICDPDQHVPEFTSLGEPSENFYVMALKTRCACPGLCKDDPIARKARYLEWKASNSR
ncbi:uncharacterized protein LOC118414393 isoform X3 [Branchiostoma floridae]|uniref:Uncharacterized protein LOC118414393 isoform X3 n=1 Tax=Branchiostoma floridae TaxID=7739 RepID=A0A9J7L1S0_BRAFL|nr:uncharacterized protein LOC118414393 isoform X3 [Branchiostoma floridae]